MVDPEDQPACSIPRRARRAPTSTRSASIAKSAAGSRCRRLRAQERRRLHRLDRHRRSVSRGDADVARRPQRCRCSARQRRRLERRFLLTNPDGYSLTYNGLVIVAEKRRSHGWQAFGSYTLSRASGCRRPAAPTPPARRSARSSPPQPIDVRPGSQRPHQRARPAAQRSAAHVPADGQRRRAADRSRGRRQPAALQRQAVGGHDAGRVGAAGRRARAARAARHAPAVVADAARSARVASRSRSAAPAASSCCSTCSMCSTTRRRKSWRLTIVQPQNSSSRGEVAFV